MLNSSHIRYKQEKTIKLLKNYIFYDFFLFFKNIQNTVFNALKRKVFLNYTE